MRYILNRQYYVANPYLRIILLEIHSTSYSAEIIGYSVRVQRFYSDWEPKGRRLLYGRNAWDFSTKEYAVKQVKILVKKLNREDKNAKGRISKKNL